MDAPALAAVGIVYYYFFLLCKYSRLGKYFSFVHSCWNILGSLRSGKKKEKKRKWEKKRRKCFAVLHNHQPANKCSSSLTNPHSHRPFHLAGPPLLIGRDIASRTDPMGTSEHLRLVDQSAMASSSPLRRTTPRRTDAS